jgi:hypothetical protein
MCTIDKLHILVSEEFCFMLHLSMFSVYVQHIHQYIFCDICGSHVKVTVFWAVVIQCSLVKR